MEHKLEMAVGYMKRAQLINKGISMPWIRSEKKDRSTFSDLKKNMCLSNSWNTCRSKVTTGTTQMIFHYIVHQEVAEIRRGRASLSSSQNARSENTATFPPAHSKRDKGRYRYRYSRPGENVLKFITICEV